MANGIDWFRWHHGTAADPKFGLVAKKAGARFGDVVTVWALILEQASANLDRGAFGPLDCETTDFLLGAEDGTTARILAAMDDRDLTGGGRVVRWDKRQPKRERETPDTSTARVQKLRAKASDKDGVTADETPCNATERQETPREEKSREEEKREELKVNPTVEGKPPTERRSTDTPDGSLAVFEYWQQVMGHHNAKLDAKRVKAIKGRLKDGYSVEDLCRAVDGCKYDPWSQGVNDRQAVYDDIELICRDGPKVDKFRRIAGHGPPKQAQAQTLTKAGQATARNIEAWLQEKQGHG